MDTAFSVLRRASLRRAIEVANVILAMSGWRVRHLSVAWVVCGAASLALGRRLIAMNDARATLTFFALTLTFYYVGNALLLASDLPRRLVCRYGEERAFRMYETVLALMFINQGLGIGAVAALRLGPLWVLPLSTSASYVVGSTLFVLGLVVKVWATVVVGVDVYYYRDMFLGRPVSELSSSGPYRVFSNPMYGVGQLHAYGYAILSRSSAGLLATIACHALIYGFYYAVERPFVERAYSGPPPLG